MNREQKLERLFIAAALEPKEPVQEKEKEFDWRVDAMRNEFWKKYRILPFVHPSLWERFKKRMEDEGRLTKGTSDMVYYQP